MILFFFAFFVLPVSLGIVWGLTDPSLFAVLFGVSMLPWVWVWISGIWDALTGRVNHRTFEDNPSSWYQP